MAHEPNAPLHLGECQCINITRAEPITFVTAFVRRSADCALPSVVIVCSEKKDESEIKWIRIVWVRQRELHSPLRFRMQSCHRVAIDSIILWCKQRRRRVGRVSIPSFSAASRHQGGYKGCCVYHSWRISPEALAWRVYSLSRSYTHPIINISIYIQKEDPDGRILSLRPDTKPVTLFTPQNRTNIRPGASFPPLWSASFQLVIVISLLIIRTWHCQTRRENIQPKSAAAVQSMLLRS